MCEEHADVLCFTNGNHMEVKKARSPIGRGVGVNGVGMGGIYIYICLHVNAQTHSQELSSDRKLPHKPPPWKNKPNQCAKC